MELKKLGITQERVPEIGFGTWKYSGGIEPLRAAIEHGGYLIDTAEAYGTETIVGEAIRGMRDRTFIATKALPRNFRRRDLIKTAENSLARLGTDFIDLYQLHWPNYTIPIEETMGAMEELVDTGKVRFIGVSNFSIKELESAQAALSRYRIVSNQVRYSLVDRTIESGLLTYCQQRGITIIAFSPLGMNFSQIRALDPERVLTRIGSECGKSEAQIALNWLICKEGVIAIPRASTADHAIENCQASGWRLSQTDLSQLDAKIKYTRRGRVEDFVRRRAKHAFQLFGLHT